VLFRSRATTRAAPRARRAPFDARETGAGA